MPVCSSPFFYVVCANIWCGVLHCSYCECKGLLQQLQLLNPNYHQIAEIEKRAADLKQEIADYRSDRLKRVEEYITDLTKKADTLDDIQLEIRQFLKDSHTATIITEKECKSGELLKAHGLNTTAKFDYDEQTLIKNGGEEHITNLLTFF